MQPETSSNHPRDIIVIGASAGGVTALREIVEQLPASLPAAVFIVLHISREAPSLLGSLLDQLGPLTARTAEDGDPIEPGMIYVAPRDRHLTLTHHDRVRVSFGPPQDHHRPSIDVLFRSAAHCYGPRVIGVVLTGFLSDGAAGLRAIKDQGGIAIVQDPRSAEYSAMPENALRAVEADHCVPLAEIPQLLVQLSSSSQTKPSRAQAPGSPSLQFEADADLGDVGALETVADPSSFLCPDCGGSLWQMRGEGPPRFRCRVGHGHSIESLRSSQEPNVEQALWAAARSLEDHAALSRRLADSWRNRRAEDVVKHFMRAAERSSSHAAIIRSMLGTPVQRDAGRR